MYENCKKIAAAASAAVFMLTGAAITAGADGESTKLRVMCLGDSITDGFWMQGGYRNTLCDLLTENGFAEQVDFVGPNWGGSGYDPQHAGYSGYSIDNIAQSDSISGQRTGISSFYDYLAENYPADVIFMQIGTNDILSLYDLEHFGERYEKLPVRVSDSLPPDGMLYLATLPVMDAANNLYISDYFFTVESMDEAVESCNAQIRAAAQKMQESGRRVQIAEVNRVLTKADLYDGVHPSADGYAKMGQFWYQKLSAYLRGETELPDVTVTATVPVTETTAAVTTTTAAAAQTAGDTDGNGVTEAIDAVMLAKHLSTERPLDNAQAERADMDGDRDISAVDLTLLKRAVPY